MARQAVFKVSLTKTSTSTIAVDYRTKDGTATAPDDYTAVSGTLTFLPGQRVKTITVSVRDEIPNSLKEQFTIELSKPVNCRLGRTSGVLELVTGPESDKNGPLIKNGLLTNAYHKEVGRGGYFHEFSGTSEGQSIAIEGAFLAYAALRNGTEDEKAAATWYKQIGQKMVDAMGSGNATGPMLRQPIPDDVNTITLLHWLFAARGDIPEQSVNYSFEVAPVGGKLLIPQYVNGTHKGGPDIYRIFQIFPNTSQLLYTSPYSPAFDIEEPAEDTSIKIDTTAPGESGSSHWTLNDKTVELTLPAGAPAGVEKWVVVYGYNNAGTIKQGAAEEAYPFWTNIDPSYAACAPDTFRWFEYAMTVAAQYDDRSGKATDWTKLRNALRRTAVRGQNITDLREIFKPLPNFEAIPASGEPSGMFCYSNNPGAGTPPQDVIDAGGNIDWKGYKYWSREGGSGKDAPTLAQLQRWETGDAMKKLSEMADGKAKNGAIVAKVPAAGPDSYNGYEYQLGRGINDTWRSAKPYQDPDQFMLVVSYGMKGYWEEETAGKNNGYAGGATFADGVTNRWVQKNYFISLSKAYNPAKRYTAFMSDTREIGFKEYGGDLLKLMLQSIFYYRVNGIRKDGTLDPDASNKKAFNYAKANFFNQYSKTDFTPDDDLCFELIPIEAFQRDNVFNVRPELTLHDGRGFLGIGPQPEGRRQVPWVTTKDTFPVPAAVAGTVLPRDTIIENFGVAWKPAMDGKADKVGGIIFMRLLSGPSKQWVLDNLEKAVRGSPMPFFPGAMPFAINANLTNQEFVGFNGNPFHGYQLPDYWYFLQTDAGAVHPDLTVSDLPTAALTGEIEYVITANTSGGTAKPKHALLAEQQLIFLKRAQQKWQADAGYAGPFAHTFVLNTPARQTIGNPTPHTWVYTNDDPNTRWVGYQVRVVESLAKLVWLGRNDAGWTTAVSLALDMAVTWLTRLNVDWPNLNGKDYADPDLGTIKIYGMPTDYDSPANGGVKTAYEEPHAVSLVLRAAVWLQISGKLDAAQTTLAQTLAKRSWDYLEMRWRAGADDTMRYTWANISAQTREQYYGFWHFEIITTICHLLENPTTIPTGATVAILRDRLVKAQIWTKAHTE